MDTHDATTDATATFERKLETLLLESFGKGARVEGTWTVGSSDGPTPTWAVQVTKTEPAESAYDPELIEE
jgi:hypothetical protein